MKPGPIGTGVMGSAVARHLLETEHEVAVYNRTKTKADLLVTKGAIWADTPRAVAERSNILFTMVGCSRDVEETYYGQSGIFSADISGRTLVDLTTSTPSLAEEIAKIAKEEGTDVLDAPIFDGDLGAKNDTLTIMIGGEKAVYDQVLSLFKGLGMTFTLHSSAGRGQYTKVANQTMIAGTMTGMTGMLVRTQENGLDLRKVTETLSGGSAANWSLNNYSPRVLKEDYTPGFFVKHLVKDLKIVSEEAKKMDLTLLATTQALKLYEELADRGFENNGTRVLIKLWWPERKTLERKS